MKSTYTIYIVILTSLLFSLPVQAASFLPATTNYTVNDYQAGHQNWACTQGEDGMMYFGNNSGLLTYDGFFWELYPLPGKCAVRSVYAEGERIYTGSFEEFGYFVRDSFGNLSYTSLSQNIRSQIRPNDEIWNIARIKDKLYFQSFTGWYVYDGNQVEALKTAETFRPLYWTATGDIGYTQLINGDFYSFDGKNFKCLFTKETIHNDEVVSLFTTPEKCIYLLTAQNGIYRYANGKVTPLRTEIDKQLQADKGNRCTLLNDSVMVIGTISNGVYGLSLEGTLLWNLNRDNQLNNNSVMGVYCDKNQNLWTVLDDGIAFSRTKTSTALLLPSAKDMSLGMVYDIERVKDLLYIATNQGVYTYHLYSGEIKQIPHCKGQNWYVKQIDSQIFIGNNSKTLCIENGIVHPIPGTSNSTCIQTATINGQNILVEATYADLRIWKKNAKGIWTVANTIQGFSAPIHTLEIDGSGTIWASHMYSGIYRIKLDDTLHTVKECERISSLDPQVPTNKIYIFKVRGKVIFSDSNGYFSYNEITQSMEPYALLNDIEYTVKNAHTAIEVHQNEMIWLINNQEYALLRFEKGKFQIIKRIPVSFFDSPCIEGYSRIYMDKDECYLNLNNKIARIDLQNQIRPDSLTVSLRFSQISAETIDGKKIDLGLSDTAELFPHYQYIKASVSYPCYEQRNLQFKFSLNGKLQSNIAGNVPYIQLGHLEYGTYTLQADVYNDNGKKLDTVSYQFYIQRPWSSSYPMIILYTLGGISIIFVIIRWREKSIEVKKRKEYEAQKIRQDIQLSEQQRLIVEQQKQLLEAELASKGKELASMTLGRFAKQEMLESLQKLVQEQLLKPQCGRKNMEVVLKYINEHISEEDFWEVFQQNFDLIHQKFFRTLKERYPSLTPTDLRFCALLRLNMSTKDIAQMTNLTIRGVEAARYRIRKRIEVPDGIGLVDFLLEIK